jgi:hypothetical protein
MGAAAAMQALKMFSGGQSGNTQQGNSQNAFIGMAMAEAGKVGKVLFYSPLSTNPLPPDNALGTG